MKNNTGRMLCLMLAFMLFITAFTACKSADDKTESTVTPVDTESSPTEPVIIEVDSSAPFTIAKDTDGQDVVILTPGKDNEVLMTVAADTTLEKFLSLVTAKEGYTLTVRDASGEVTDGKALMADGMIFRVFKEGETEAAVTYTIQVVSEEQIKNTVSQAQQQKEESQKNPQSTGSNASAGNTGSVVSGGTASSKNSSITPDSAADDDVLYGKNITLGTIWNSFYSGTDGVAQAWQSRFAAIQKKHNCKTTVISMDGTTAVDIIVKEVMAGKAGADVYEISIAGCRDIAKKKAAADLLQSNTLNMKQYDTAATECVSFGGKVYGAAFASQGANPMGVFYNKEIVAKYAPEYNIEELYRTKKWNFDTFRTIAKLCTVDTDGDGSTDIFGLRNCGHLVGMALTANAGGTATKENGRVVAAMCSAAGIEALQWCKDMIKTDKSWRYSDDNNACLKEFAAGKSAFCATFFHFYSTITDHANFSYGFVPTPIGYQQKDYKIGNYDGRLFMVPKTKQSRLDEIGIWLNDVSFMSSQLLNIQLKQLARNGFDATAQEVYSWMVKNMTPEYACFSTEVSSAVDSSIISAAKDPAKIMESIKSKAQKECDDCYGDLY